ncbi:MAG: response regulator, partial [Oscillospiraceae bacterium]|nr:response regulator [Oscillospiraceae bacterium]
TAVFADPQLPDGLYLGTESGRLFRGVPDSAAPRLDELASGLGEGVNWISCDAGRIWVVSNSSAGYLDEKGVLRMIHGIPSGFSIEMMTSDYQGNLWFASSRQGVLKIVTSNFQNLTELAGLPAEVVNSTCLFEGMLYCATDEGIRVIDGNNAQVENELTEFIGATRVRCIVADAEGNLWLATYNDGKGIVCYTAGHEIVSYTEEDGLASNKVRCLALSRDGALIAGTNGGLSELRGGRIVRSVGADDGLNNTVLLTVEEGGDGEIYAGTDGDGIYVIGRSGVERLGRDEGLTSDVILRIKRDEKRGVYWIITSNSIEYMKNGEIFNVSAFPYNNNYDVYYDDADDLWILSSYGIFCVRAEDMLGGGELDYRLYNTANGLAGAPTGNAFSELDGNGNLYVSSRVGVSRVNINHFFEKTGAIRLGVKSVYCGDTEIIPDGSGTYTLPPDAGRIQIKAAVMDYTVSNPTIRLYLEGSDDPGVTAVQNKLAPLEFTGLKYGSYTLHIQVVNAVSGEVYQDETVPVVKQPRMLELLAVRILLVALLALLAGVIVWRMMTGTVIRRQYEQIQQARDEAERANTVKTRFLANMSREIQTPINTIMGMDEMILREDAAEVPKGYFMSVVNYALDIRNATESLSDLIKDLLDMSRIESGKMALAEQEYDPGELLRNIVRLVRARSEQRHISFDADIDGKLPRRLYGDAGKIKQIVLNLLSNAAKNTDKGGFSLKVTVTGKTETSCHLRISVKDTGIGVRKEDIDKLFSSYGQLEEKTEGAPQGTGLGLDISRQFAELMDGKLWCESVYGEGSEFLFTLEQKIVDGTELGQFIETAEGTAKGPYVPQFIAPEADVLVVDDDPMNLSVIKGLLRATRLYVTTAESGEECLEKLKYGKFNVVLLDQLMPGMDGIETAARIRAAYPDLPLYALTDGTAAGGEEFYRAKGFDGYLEKPIDSTALENAIMRHLPEEIMMRPAGSGAAEENAELPAELRWLSETEGISVNDGIRNSGGTSSFLFALNLFLDTIDGNAGVIESAYRGGDVRLFAAKVRALKNSAHMIGAGELASLAESIEGAASRGDAEFIRGNTDKLMADYRAYTTKLARLRAENA